MKRKVNTLIRRLLSCCAIALIISLMAFSTLAAETFDYNDYITNVTADGDNDLVSFQYPVDRATWYASFSDGSGGSLFQGGTCEIWLSSSAKYRFECRPFGGQMDDFNTLRCDNIPDGTLLEGTYVAHYEGGSYSVDQVGGIIQWYSSSGSIVQNQTFALSNFPTITSVGTFSVELDKPTGATSFAVLLCAENFAPSYQGTVYLELNSCRFTMSISSLYRLQEQTGKTNELLDEVSKQLAEQGKTMQDVLDQQEQTNEKLDDIISGGAAGDDLIDAGDKIEDAGAGMGDSLDGMQNYEDQYTGEIDNYMADILAGADINLLSLPLDFTVRYINKIVEGIPRAYMVVFTLPMVLGILFFFAQHIVRAPRPDPTGDVVTRETFTTTEILEGRGKGRSTTTRTTTTSVITGIERGSG